MVHSQPERLTLSVVGVDEAHVPVELEMALRVLVLVSVLLVVLGLVLVESFFALVDVLGEHADEVVPRIAILLEIPRTRPIPGPDAILERETLGHVEQRVVDVLHHPVGEIQDVLVVVAAAEKRVVTQELVARNKARLGVGVNVVIANHVAGRVEHRLFQLPLGVLRAVDDLVLALDPDEVGNIGENLAMALLGMREAILSVDDGQNLEVGLRCAGLRVHIATLVEVEHVEPVVKAQPLQPRPIVTNHVNRLNHRDVRHLVRDPNLEHIGQEDVLLGRDLEAHGRNQGDCTEGEGPHGVYRHIWRANSCNSIDRYPFQSK
eukprot:4495233-Pyramimonas_sp.AAC.1